MTAPNSLEKYKLYFEYQEDDVFHDLLVKRVRRNKRLRGSK